MKVFRDLFIHGSSDQVADLMQNVARSMTEGWRRDRAQEESLRQFLMRQGSVYCFSCTQEKNRPAAALFLLEKEPSLFCVSNITPRSQHQLSCEEYNAILDEFCERFIRPAAEEAGLRVELTSTEADLEHWLSEPAAAKLRSFAAEANKGSGASRPSDREKWNEFLVAAHLENSPLDWSTLRRWLVEVENWSPEVADRLAWEYQFGRELLAFKDGQRRSA